MYVQQTSCNAIPLPCCESAMCQVSHVTAHAAVVTTIFAAIQRLVGGMWADFLEDTAQDIFGQALCVVGTVI
jgi:hypothetical protein